jgi:SAM-dependent methyltransferase
MVHKNDYFYNNKDLYSQQRKINTIYLNQPIRLHCKLCKTLLSDKVDFYSHSVGYKFCIHCGHLNGEKDDTENFTNDVYKDNVKISYSSNYVDDDYLTRVQDIYTPKIDFMIDSIGHSDFSVLDVGCGGGHLVLALLNKGIDARGLDISKDMIEYGNKQIDLLNNIEPLQSVESEEDLIRAIEMTDHNVISAIGVIEHLRDPGRFFAAFKNSKADYLFACVPMFSLSVYIENVFKSIYPRNLSGGHTHIFTNDSLQWMYDHFELDPISEWRFGSDIMDLFRSMLVSIQENNASDVFIDKLNYNLGNNIDALQSIIDQSNFSSEVHFLVRTS